jgi:subtilisin family serine protease
MKLFLILATIGLASAGTIDPSLRSALLSGAPFEAILELPQVVDQIENDAALQSLTGDAKVEALVATLTGLTGAAQAPFVTVANSLKIDYEQYWSSNIVHLKGLTAEKLNKLVQTPGEFILRAQHTAGLYPDVVVEEEDVNITQTYQWGVNMVRAPQAWGRGNGAGVVVCIVDTGVHQGHTALSAAYAGAWRDTYYSTANPTDQHGHGSHCAGSVLGRANGVGVAPGARWTACRGLNHQGSGTETALIGCGQWQITSTPRPHVSSNSWGGGGGSSWYDSTITSMRNAGIIPVFAHGNNGAGCRTAGSPGDRPNLIGVGSTTNTDAMSSFSSRGPASGSTATKPEVSAPGSNIVSCGTGASNYVTMSGTSMATPHVAGAVAVILSVNPSFSYTQVLNALSSTAAHPTLSAADRNCGLPSGSTGFPNYAFGAGRIDVGRAVGA